MNPEFPTEPSVHEVIRVKLPTARFAHVSVMMFGRGRIRVEGQDGSEGSPSMCVDANY